MIVIIFLLLLLITRAIEGTDIRSIGSTIKPLELFVNLVLSTLEKLVRR